MCIKNNKNNMYYGVLQRDTERQGAERDREKERERERDREAERQRDGETERLRDG